LGLRIRNEFGQAKIKDFDRSTARDQDVRGLDIPVNNSRAMRGIESEQHLAKDGRRFVNRKPPLLQALLERLALVERHRDEELALFLADFVNNGDVRMVQRTGGARLSNKASLGGLVTHQMPGKKLDRHRAPKLEVHRSIEHPHPPGAQPLLQAVMRQNALDEGVRRERRRWGVLGVCRARRNAQSRRGRYGYIVAAVVAARLSNPRCSTARVFPE
jgi:hypothetical protein